MKKFLVVLSLFIVAAIAVYAVIGINSANKKVDINGKKFTLKYSNCQKDSEVCLNEYYLEDEFDNNWTELFTIVYSPNGNNPINVAKTMVEGNPISDLYVNEAENNAIALFGLLYKTDDNDVAIEQTVAKVMMYKFDKGIVSQQYSKRHVAQQNWESNIGREKEAIKEFNNTYSTIMKDFPPQKIYKKPLQKW